MDYYGVNSVVCDAEESDWLDVSYSERKYVEKPAKKKKINFKFKLNKKIKIFAIAAVCVAALACMMFIDGNFSKEVFNTVKTAYSSVFIGNKPTPISAKIELPSNVDLVEVNEGVATFSGGRATLSFTDGKVTAATENSVTVAIDENTSITYSNLTDVYVAVDDVVTTNSLLGKYEKNFTATILNGNGEAVKDVVGSDKQLTWNV